MTSFLHSIPPRALQSMEEKAQRCAEAQPKPMAAYWYEADVPALLAEIERLREELMRMLWVWKPPEEC